MNDGNIRWYLKCRMEEIDREIKQREAFIKGAENNIDDWHKEINNLKVHYTSLLNTMIAYGDKVEEKGGILTYMFPIGEVEE